MKEKREFSRKQFLTGSASVVFGAIFGKLSEHVYAEEKSENTNRENNVNAGTEDRDWDELPLDMLNGAYLVSDPESKLFGGTVEAEDYLLTQYFHVCPGLKVMLTDTGEDDGKGGWVGFSKDLKPNAVLRTSTTNAGTGKEMIVSVPEGVYYLRGSGKAQPGNPRAWVRNFSLYAFNCGLNKPDLTDYTEIMDLTFDQSSRAFDSGAYNKDAQDCPSIGDMFFSPAGTDIILTFNNANIAPYIHAGDNFKSTSRQRAFTGHYGFGYTWYHCKTPDICCALGAYYETAKGWAKKLTIEELQAANPHLYIKFPSTAANTLAATKSRTIDLKKNYQRRFTVVHLTDIHGDMDSTQAACAYADHIGADLIALTGDFVTYSWYHGCNILHTIIRNAKTPVVYSLGNHDVADRTDQQIYDQNIEPIRDVLRASKEHAYYYRDFYTDGKTVRVISLYPFCYDAKQRSRGYYTEEQLHWLCDAMATTPDGGHIFILRHFPHRKPIMPEGEAAMFYDYSDSSDSEYSWLNMGSDPVKDIVDAYNKKEEIFAQYTGNLKNNVVETVTIKYDFTNRPGSEFVAYFTGHVHIDHVGYVHDTRTPQVVLGSLCTTGVKGSEDYASYTALSTPRDYGTDSQIAFNVFTFDFQKKKIYVARVGNGKFLDREKTWMEILY